MICGFNCYCMPMYVYCMCMYACMCVHICVHMYACFGVFETAISSRECFFPHSSFNLNLLLSLAGSVVPVCYQDILIFSSFHVTYIALETLVSNFLSPSPAVQLHIPLVFSAWIPQTYLQPLFPTASSASSQEVWFTQSSSAEAGDIKPVSKFTLMSKFELFPVISSRLRRILATRELQQVLANVCPTTRNKLTKCNKEQITLVCLFKGFWIF